MPIAAIAAFWAVSILLVLVPGADWAYVIASGLRDHSVLPAVGGLLAGYILLTAAVASGVAALVAKTPAVLTTLTTVGAFYLLWLGAITLLRPSIPQPAAAPTVAPWPRRAARGAGISGLNPKALLLFLALLPQFAARTAPWPFAAQIALLGLIHTANCGIVYTGVGTTARRVLRTRPAVAKAVSRSSGIVMVLIGTLLLAEHLIA
ncbi:MAG TPA: LysE family translocator [Actinospica sp.]|jgi:threonine/homoserine/homoserine lactone efflux protein|nr:LysE family translocator [Actinospica sp.]